MASRPTPRHYGILQEAPNLAAAEDFDEGIDVDFGPNTRGEQIDRQTDEHQNLQNWARETCQENGNKMDNLGCDMDSVSEMPVHYNATSGVYLSFKDGQQEQTQQTDSPKRPKTPPKTLLAMAMEYQSRPKSEQSHFAPHPLPTHQYGQGR